MLKLSIFLAVVNILLPLTDGAAYFQINFKSFTNTQGLGFGLPNGFSCQYILGGQYLDKCTMCHVQFTTFIPFIDESSPVTNASKFWDLPGGNATYNDTIVSSRTNPRPGGMVDNCADQGCTPSGVMLMDTFYWDLTTVMPGRSSSSQNQQGTKTLYGKASQTNTLKFDYYFYCDGTFGLNCDLRCDPVQGSNTYKCTSVIDNSQYSCGISSIDGQAVNCFQCADFAGNGTCLRPTNTTQPPVIVNSSGKKDYRTATIVLGVFLGLAFIVLLVLLALYCFTDIPDKYARRSRTHWSRTAPQQSQRPLITAHPPMTNAIRSQQNAGDYNNSNGFPKPVPTFSETKVNSNPDPGMAPIPRRSIDSDTSIPDPGYAATLRPAPLPPYNHVPPNAKPESYHGGSRGSQESSSQGSAPTAAKRSREVQV